MTIAEYAAHVGVGGGIRSAYISVWGGGGGRGAVESLVRNRLKLGSNAEMGYKYVACIEMS
jgi:hypothetical protein